MGTDSYARIAENRLEDLGDGCVSWSLSEYESDLFFAFDDICSDKER